ncbi:hypothetical protein ACFQ1I_09740 [Kitasatospora arboriphila]
MIGDSVEILGSPQVHERGVDMVLLDTSVGPEHEDAELMAVAPALTEQAVALSSRSHAWPCLARWSEEHGSGSCTSTTARATTGTPATASGCPSRSAHRCDRLRQLTAWYGRYERWHGLDRALRRSPAQAWFRRRAARRLAVLGYHGIDDPAGFARHLDLLLETARPVSLQQVEEAVRTGRSCRPAVSC